MRMWMVSPKVMCRQHLLGEHVEIHMFVGTIRLGRSIAGYVENGLVEVHNFKARHDALVAEMVRRGMQHWTPVRRPFTRRIGKVDRRASRRELARRCPACRSRQRRLRR
jgi:hypothetical protein